MMRKGKRSPTWAGVSSWRVQHSWKSLFVIVVCLVLATTTLVIDQLFQAARIYPVHLVNLPTVSSIMLQKRIVEESNVKSHRSVLKANVGPQLNSVLWKVSESHSSGLTSVRNIVSFPQEVMLLVEAMSGSVAPRKDDVVCLFGDHHKTGVFTIEWKDDHHSVLAVRCEHPPEQIFFESNKGATLVFKESNFALPSSAEYTTNSSWIPLVYESVTDTDSVILFVKGLLDSKGRPDNYSRALHELHCQYGDVVKSRVKLIAQEVVRCEKPPEEYLEQLEGVKISLFVPKMGVLPSVAYFSNAMSMPSSGDRQFHTCACTMLWNQGPFLREWIIYHGFLGIERWFLYDNNSDDDTEEVLGGLQSEYNVSRHPWPWIKTQEAGFSHCALRARAHCKWVLFADVDEFVYPAKDLLELVYGSALQSSHQSKKVLPKSWVESKLPVNWEEVAERGSTLNNTSVLRRLIERTLEHGAAIGKKVGEVRLVCHNFGPSGLSQAPHGGVMVGYTCRMQWPQRHKSFIYLDAMSDSLLNVVHHFALSDGYKQQAVHARIAVINHYKFQAWEIFKAKFVRRVATYVVDWRQQTALSNDRAPGLGLDDVEPEDWPTRYCEEVDWGLKNFTENTFRHPQTKLFPWQSL